MLHTFDFASAALRRPRVAAPGASTGAGVAAGVGTAAGAGGEDMLARMAEASATFTGWIRWMHRFFLALQSAQAGLSLGILSQTLLERVCGQQDVGIKRVKRSRSEGSYFLLMIWGEMRNDVVRVTSLSAVVELRQVCKKESSFTWATARKQNTDEVSDQTVSATPHSPRQRSYFLLEIFY